MTGSGSDSKVVPVISPEGEKTYTRVISSRDIIEIGGWTFKRVDLLFALGIKDADSDNRR